MGDQAIRTTLSSVQAVDGDGTFNRCCLQDRSGYRKGKFAQVGLIELVGVCLPIRSASCFQCYVLLVERETRRLPAATGLGTVNRVHLPIVHALLPGQDEETYVRLG